MTFVQLQQLIASTNEQIAEPSVFWSWGGILAICTGLVVLGFAIDWLLRRRHKDHILLKMSEFQDRLERLPVRDWQVAVARAGAGFWDMIGGVVPLMGRWLGTTLSRLGIARIRLSTMLTRTVGAIGILVLIVVQPVASQIPHWSGETLVYILIFLVAATLASATEYLHPFPSKCKLLRFFAGGLIGFFPTFSASLAFTLMACGIGTAILDCNQETAWFVCDAASISVLNSSLLAWFNFCFDLATILLSVDILRYVVQKRRYFVRLAALDIGISGILTVLLHTVLLWLAPERSVGLSDAFPIALDWFLQVITFSAPSTDPNWPLTPVLFTTFIPVVLYMSAFLFLGIIVRYPARIAAYLCGLLWEKEQTPFLVFAVALSGMLTLAKAFSEWNWFVDKLGG